MRECRFFPWCSYIEDHGCTKDSCRHYQPMSDMEALLELADTLDSSNELDCRGCKLEGAGCVECSAGVAHEAARRIRELCGEVVL